MTLFLESSYGNSSGLLTKCDRDFRVYCVFSQTLLKGGVNIPVSPSWVANDLLPLKVRYRPDEIQNDLAAVSGAA